MESPRTQAPIVISDEKSVARESVASPENNVPSPSENNINDQSTNMNASNTAEESSCLVQNKDPE